MKKIFVFSLIMALVLVLLGFSAIPTRTSAASYLTHDEVADIIKEDINGIFNHLESLITTPEGETYIFDLRSIDLWWFPSLIWEEDGVIHEKPLGTLQYPEENVTREQVDRAEHHKVILSSEDCSHCLFPIGTWLLYPDGRVIPQERGIRVEFEIKQ